MKTKQLVAYESHRNASLDADHQARFKSDFISTCGQCGMPLLIAEVKPKPYWTPLVTPGERHSCGQMIAYGGALLHKCP